MSRLALSRICPVLYRTSKDSWPQYFCLFVPSTCLALSRTCPVPSRVRYHEGNSQGPHSFNLVFVCLFVCLCHAWRYPVSVPYCTVPAKTAGHNILQSICLFVLSTCLALSRTCPVPSRVRYHQENEYICEVYRGNAFSAVTFCVDLCARPRSH